jgi:hypothetical protein
MQVNWQYSLDNKVDKCVWQKVTQIFNLLLPCAMQVDNIRVPLIMAHGKNDVVVNPGESERMFEVMPIDINNPPPCFIHFNHSSIPNSYHQVPGFEVHSN